MDREEKLASLIGKLAEFADYPADRMTGETRLWHDARIGGDDYWEFMVWFSHAFRVDLTGMNLRDFGPSEAPWPWERTRSKFKELRLSDLLELSECESWTASGIGERLKIS